MSTLSELIDEGTRKIMNDLGKTILAIWRRQAPSRTDRLRESIGYSLTGANGEWTLTFHYLYYGTFVSLGTLKNADKRAYNLTPFELPPWNVAPAKRLGGIVPRYWTSLSDQVEAIDRDLSEAFQELFDKSFEEFTQEITKKIESLRGK